MVWCSRRILREKRREERHGEQWLGSRRTYLLVRNTVGEWSGGVIPRSSEVAQVERKCVAAKTDGVRKQNV